MKRYLPIVTFYENMSWERENRFISGKKWKDYRAELKLKVTMIYRRKPSSIKTKKLISGATFGLWPIQVICSSTNYLQNNSDY